MKKYVKIVIEQLLIVNDRKNEVTTSVVGQISIYYDKDGEELKSKHWYPAK